VAWSGVAFFLCLAWRLPKLGVETAKDRALPKAFSSRSKTSYLPWISLLVINALTLLFVNTANLTIISSFASSTFLLIFAAINLSAWILRKQINPSAGYFAASVLPLTGLLLSLASWITLMVCLWRSSPHNLILIMGSYAAVIVVELVFSKRCLFLKKFN